MPSTSLLALLIPSSMYALAVSSSLTSSLSPRSVAILHSRSTPTSTAAGPTDLFLFYHVRFNWNGHGHSGQYYVISDCAGCLRDEIRVLCVDLQIFLMDSRFCVRWIIGCLLIKSRLFARQRNGYSLTRFVGAFDVS